MVTRGLVVQLEARAGKEDEVAAFLEGALPLVEREPETVAWFALRLGTSSFAIVDAFPGEEGRLAHLAGPVATATMMTGYWNNTAAVSGFQIDMSSGNIASGTVKVYGRL